MEAAKCPSGHMLYKSVECRTTLRADHYNRHGWCRVCEGWFKPTDGIRKADKCPKGHILRKPPQSSNLRYCVQCDKWYTFTTRGMKAAGEYKYGSC